MLKNTQILPKGTLDTIKRSRPIYTIGRKVRFAVGELLGSREVPGLTGRTHYNDFMLVSTDPAVVETYVRGANQFIDILERSCSEAGRDPSTIGEVLEVGCGYGRIVRELRKRMPAARVHVSDVIDGAARFTAAEFGCHEMLPLEDAGAEYNERFDLVYLLSVYTHLRRDLVAANLRRLSAILKPDGVAVITLHGRGSAEIAERYNQYWLDKARVLNALDRDGYYYERYPYYYGEYGLTWFTRPTFDGLIAEVAPELQAVAYHPLDLEGHQDVAVFRKVAKRPSRHADERAQNVRAPEPAEA
jgi:SAM-dependent methyltransferase